MVSVPFNSNVFAVLFATSYELLLSCVIPETLVIVTMSPFSNVCPVDVATPGFAWVTFVIECVTLLIEATLPTPEDPPAPDTLTSSLIMYLVPAVVTTNSCILLAILATITSAFEPPKSEKLIVFTID